MFFFVLIWMVIIFIFMCTTPAFGVFRGDFQFSWNPNPHWSKFFVFPETGINELEFISHFLLFFVLAALLMQTTKRTGLVFCVAFFYGMFIEIIQPIFGRGAELVDVIANLAGILLFILLYKMEKMMKLIQNV